MPFWDRYHFIPRECVSRRSDPRNSTRSKPDITPWISFSNLAINCCMAFLLGSPLWILIHPTTYIIGGTPIPFAACRYAGQVGNLQADWQSAFCLRLDTRHLHGAR